MKIGECTFPDPTAPIIAHSFPLRMRNEIFLRAKKFGSPVQLADTSRISTAVSFDKDKLLRNLLFNKPMQKQYSYN